MNMKDVLRGTASNDIKFFGGSDSTILIRAGYQYDSKLALLQHSETAPAPGVLNFINTRPEGTRNK